MSAGETENINDFFFFSSRRRHTRLQGDWSSDVCSSDLVLERHHHVVRSTQNLVRAGTHDHCVWVGRVVIRRAVEPIGAGGKELLRRNEKHTVGGAAQPGGVANVGPQEQLGVAGRKNRLHGFFSLLFGDVIHLRHVRYLDALRIHGGQRQDAEGQNHHGNHRFEQREARQWIAVPSISRHDHPPYSCHWLPSQWYSRTRPVAPSTEMARAVEGLPGMPMKTVPFTIVFPPSMKAPVVENFMIGGPPDSPPK